MNFYPHHIGDYLSATAHLSWTEDCAYRRLLDAYYTREAALPADVAACCRLVRALSKDERAAVDVVLREFFALTDEGWRHGRCDEEIGKATAKRAKAAESANKRWQPKSASPGNANADATAGANAMRTHMPTHSEGNAPNPNPNPKRENTVSPCEGEGADSVRFGDLGSDDPGEPVTPTPAAMLAIEARRLGIPCNGSDPRLEAVAGWVKADEWATACEAAKKAKALSLGYVLAIVQRRRQEASALALVPASPATPARAAWERDSDAMLAEAARLGLEVNPEWTQDELRWHILQAHRTAA